MAKALNVTSDLQYWNAFVRLRFFRLSIREKALSILFIGALLGVWLSFQVGRHGASRIDIRSANSMAQEQGVWLNNEAIIEGRYNTLIDNINPEQLPSVEDVNARIDGLIRKYGFIDFRINTPRSNEGIPLTFHTFTIDLRKADYNKLIEFTSEIKSNLPYVSLRQITIQAQRRTPQFLDVNLELKSIEYTP